MIYNPLMAYSRSRASTFSTRFLRNGWSENPSLLATKKEWEANSRLDLTYVRACACVRACMHAFRDLVVRFDAINIAAIKHGHLHGVEAREGAIGPQWLPSRLKIKTGGSNALEIIAWPAKERLECKCAK